MQRPTQHRIVELQRTGAWPLLVFAIGTGRIRLDLELAATKHLQGLGVIVEAQNASDFATARTAGQRLGWTSEAQRYDRAAQAIQAHLDRLKPR